MAGPGKEGRDSSSPDNASERPNEEPNRGNLSRPKPQGIISFNKKAQIISVVSLAAVFGLIFYGVFDEGKGGSKGPGNAILSDRKQVANNREAKAIKDMIPETPVLPRRVEVQQTDNSDTETPGWFNGDIKQEQQTQAPMVVPAPEAPPPPPPPPPVVTDNSPTTHTTAPIVNAGDAAAIAAGSSIGGGGGGGGGGFSPKNVAPVATLPVPTPIPPKEEDLLRTQRIAFLNSAKAGVARNYINSVRTAGLSQYEIKAGWMIPAVMEHGINTELQSMLTARITQNVYDTATGQYLLLPQGAQLIGKYDNKIAYNQDRLMVSWDRVIFPDGSSVNLESQAGVDAQGYAGFEDKVNNHYGSLLTGAVLLSVVTGIPAFISTRYANNTSNVPSTLTIVNSAGETVTIPNPSYQTEIARNSAIQAGTQGLTGQLANVGQTIAQRFIGVQPTIEIRPGYRFFIRVQKDLAFLRPYKFGNADQPSSITGGVNSMSGLPIDSTYGAPLAPNVIPTATMPSTDLNQINTMNGGFPQVNQGNQQQRAVAVPISPVPQGNGLSSGSSAGGSSPTISSSYVR
ncbi:MAG: TrbI/VirB10 family protein [Pseudomonadota bacterium]